MTGTGRGERTHQPYSSVKNVTENSLPSLLLGAMQKTAVTLSISIFYPLWNSRLLQREVERRYSAHLVENQWFLNSKFLEYLEAN
jgi:hypothetical protein